MKQDPTTSATTYGQAVIEYAKENITECQRVLHAVDPSELASAVFTIKGGKRIYFSASGRSLLSAKAFAMRLMHLGFDSYIVGETSTPAIAKHDVLIVVSASGKGPGVIHAETAARVGATSVAITASEKSALASVSTRCLVLPAGTEKAPTSQYGGSLFEQSVLLLGDAICRKLQDDLGLGHANLDDRHANLA